MALLVGIFAVQKHAGIPAPTLVSIVVLKSPSLRENENTLLPKLLNYVGSTRQR